MATRKQAAFIAASSINPAGGASGGAGRLVRGYAAELLAWAELQPNAAAAAAALQAAATDGSTNSVRQVLNAAETYYGELSSEPDSVGAVGPQDLLPLGLYVQSYADANGVAIAGLNREYCVPYLIFDSGRLDRLAIRLGAAGDVGSVFRIGIRQDNRGKPGATVLAEGTVAADGTAGTITGTDGWKEIAFDIPLSPGLIWLSLVGQGWATTAPRFQISTGPIPLNMGTAMATPGWAAGHGAQLPIQDNVTGTLAASPGVPTNPGVNMPAPLFALRRSS